MRRDRRKNRRGFMTADVLAAFALLIITGAALMTAVTRQRLAVMRLADTREAARLAEAALSDLQSGARLPTDTPESKVVIRPADGGAAITGQHWVEVEATVRGQTRIICGLVPDTAASDSRPSESQP